MGIIFTMARELEWTSFVCYGCFLQNLILAACTQEVWSLQHRVMRAQPGIPNGEVVIAGMSSPPTCQPVPAI